MSGRFAPFTISVLPRTSMSWEDFVQNTPPYSIALDGVVRGGPRYDPATHHLNFDHHDGVVREATMSTAMQVLFAIKGGLMKALASRGPINSTIYVNDTDQDTALAVWLLLHYKQFEGTGSIPHLSRLLALNDRWDITGGAFPMSLDDQLIRQYAWIFQPYSNLRRSGGLAQATEEVLLDNLEAVLGRLNAYMMNEAEEVDLDTRHTVLYDSSRFKIVEETGGTDARTFLYSHGMDAFVNIVARRPDGKIVYSIGRRSRFIPFPVQELYSDLNEAEGLILENGWNGSDIIGGSSRALGSGLGWGEIRDIVNKRLDSEGIH